jgi:excinuclease ABC subunit B
LSNFKLVSDLEPKGDQPKSISQLVDGIKGGLGQQTLLGVTGSGKSMD